MTKMELKTGTLEGSEYTMSFIPFETQKRKPKQKAEFAESSAHFYNDTTSRSDYREWQTRAIQHGKKQEHRPFNAKFDYNSTYGSDFDSKDVTVGRYDPDKNINTMRNKFNPEFPKAPLFGNSTNKSDFVVWKVTSPTMPKVPQSNSKKISELKFEAKSLYQDDFRKWPIYKTVNKKHELERVGKR